MVVQAADAEKKDTDPVYPDFEALKKKEFYQCCRVELEAVLDLAARYAERAEQMAADWKYGGDFFTVATSCLFWRWCNPGFLLCIR